MENKRVLWFSRHAMSVEQTEDLARIYGQCDIMPVNKTITEACELRGYIEWADVVAIVAPLPLQQSFLKFCGPEKPVLICKNDRVLVPNSEGGEDKVDFKHAGWFRIRKIEVITERL